MVHTLCCANLNTFVPFWKYAESLSTFSKDGKHADAISNIRMEKTNIFNISGFCRVIALDEWVESSKYKTLGLNYLILKLKQIGVV